MKLVDEFKTFAMKGNVVDMAVGIIIGAAFGKIVSSVVSDIIMPPLGLLIGGVNFTDLKVILKAATETNPAVTWNYGNFLQVCLRFPDCCFCCIHGNKGNKCFKEERGSKTCRTSCTVKRGSASH